MPKFSDEEKEIIKFVGFETIRFIASVYKTSKAKGVDLTTLLDKASELNQLDIEDVK